MNKIQLPKNDSSLIREEFNKPSIRKAPFNNHHTTDSARFWASLVAPKNWELVPKD